MKTIFLLSLALFSSSLFAQNGMTAIPIPSSYTNNTKTALAIDNANNKWISFYGGGVARYNGTTWSTWNSLDLPSDKVTSLVCSGSNVWAGTYRGAAVFNGNSWTAYETSNSGITNDTVLCEAAHNSDMWFGTVHGISKFDGINWTNYTSANSGLPSDYIYSIAVDAAGEAWIGTKLGFVHFDGTSWIVYNTSNTTLSDNRIRQVYIDSQGAKWISVGPQTYPRVFRFNGTAFESILQLHPELSAVDVNPTIGSGPISTGPHGQPLIGCIGYSEMTSPLTYYNLPYPILQGICESSTSRMWFVCRSAISPGLYVLDPAQHSALGLLTPDNFSYLDVNQVKAGMMNRGDMHWNTVTAKYEVPKGGGVDAIYASALWIGGLDGAGNLHQAAMTYRQSGMDYFPGPLDTTNGSCDSLTSSKYDYIWKIDQAKILEFQYYWSIGAVQNGSYVPDKDILTWPAHGNGHNMRNMAPFADVDGNGVYNPLTGGDYPAIQGDEMLYWIFNDNLSTHTETGAAPLKVEVHASAYAFNCPALADSEQVLNYTTYYNFKIYNWSGQQYHDAFIGLFQDSDLGAYNDDFVGCYPPANIAFAYNGDQDDGWSPVAAPGTYGAHPPINTIVMLNGPEAEPGDGIDNNNDGTIDEAGEKNMLTGFNTSNNDFTVMGNPEHADDYYNYMSWKWKDSTNMTYGGNGYGGTTPTHFMYDSLPYKTSGWSEPTAGNTPFDRRFVASCGPFNLNPAMPVSIDYAIVYTRDTTMGAYDSAHFALVLQNAATVRRWHNPHPQYSCAQWNVGIHDPAAENELLTLYPNPASDQLTIAYKSSSVKAQFVVYDLTGSVVQSGVLQRGEQTSISVENLPAGIYLVRVTDGKAITSKKFIRE